MTTPRVAFPDVVEVLVGWLRDELELYALGATVVARIPNPRPARMVFVRRIGGVRRDIVTDEPTLTVEAWAPTDADAYDLCQAARTIVHDARGRVLSGVRVARVTELAGPASLPDPDSDLPRYTVTVTVAVRGGPPS